MSALYMKSSYRQKTRTFLMQVHIQYNNAAIIILKIDFKKKFAVSIICTSEIKNRRGCSTNKNRNRKQLKEAGEYTDTGQCPKECNFRLIQHNLCNTKHISSDKWTSCCAALVCVHRVIVLELLKCNVDDLGQCQSVLFGTFYSLNGMDVQERKQRST